MNPSLGRRFTGWSVGAVAGWAHAYGQSRLSGQYVVIAARLNWSV
jgi:hypothetical protein